MTSLTARLETASEGTRELSDDVLLAMGYREDTRGVWWLQSFLATDTTLEGGLDEATAKGYRLENPDPTRSLTDVVAIMPEGWGWGVTSAC